MFIWTISDAVGVILFGLLMLLVVGMAVNQWLRQTLCKHDGYVGETRSCDAICAKCGKNLGFIGAWRKRESRTK